MVIPHGSHLLCKCHPLELSPVPYAPWPLGVVPEFLKSAFVTERVAGLPLAGMLIRHQHLLQIKQPLNE